MKANAARRCSSNRFGDVSLPAHAAPCNNARCGTPRRNQPRHNQLRRVLAALALCAAGLLLPGYTFYEIETEIGPIPLRWYDETIDVYHDAALTADAPADGVLSAIYASMAAWNDVDCVHPELVDAGSLADGEAFEIDEDNDSRHGTNLIIFEDSTTWAANRAGVDQWDSSLTLALTTVFHVASTGKVMNFALELNDTPFTYGIAPMGYAFDIQNTITHELGHVIGLDHTESGIDDRTWQTMYFQTEPGETMKRTLEADDTAGFCYLYSVDWKKDVPDGTGCSASAAPASPVRALPVALGLLVLALFAAIWRFRASPRGRA